MTNLEALKATVGSNYPLDENTYLKGFIDAGSSKYNLLTLNPNDDYVPTNTKTVDVIAAGLLLVLLSNPQSIKEGGYEITKADRQAIIQTRAYLLGRWGIIPEENSALNPQLYNASFKW